MTPLVEAIELSTEVLARTCIRRDEEYRVVTLGFLVRAIRAATAVKVLCDTDLGEEALVQARTVWESAILLAYISNSPTEQDRRARLFLEYDTIVRHRYIHKARQHPRSAWGKAFLDRPHLIENLEKKHEDIVRDFPDERHWAGKGMTIREIAKSVGLLDSYDFLYGWLSERVHGNVFAIGLMFEQIEPDNVQAVLHDENSTSTAVFLAAIWLLFIAQIHDQAHELGFGERIDKHIHLIGDAPV